MGTPLLMGAGTFGNSLLNSLLGYWKLDGNSTDSLAMHNGIDTDITYSVGNGKIIQGAAFNGTTSAIETFDYTELHGATKFSASCWVKFSSASTKFFLNKWDYGVRGTFGLRRTAGGELQLFICDNVADGGSNLVGTTGLALATATWYHVVIVYNGTLTGGTNRAKIYLNSSLLATTEIGTIPAVLTSGTALFSLGFIGGLAQNLDGAMDEAGLWNRDLVQLEVTTLYNSGTGIQYPF